MISKASAVFGVGQLARLLTVLVGCRLHSQPPNLRKAQYK